MFALSIPHIALLSAVAVLIFGPRFFEGIVLGMRDGLYGFKANFDMARAEGKSLPPANVLRALKPKD